MGKHEPMTAKAIANKIKAKGLQKIKYYCEMCKKQCRDDNGFKCHIMSESHQRQALIVSENPEKFVSDFSKQFMDGFMYILRARYRTKRILANTVFQEYIKERDHIHMNGTRWTSLSEFARWLDEKGYVKAEDSERGVMITYIDKDPETLKRQELEAKRAQQIKEAAERTRVDIERQRQETMRVLKETEKEEPSIEPIPIIKLKKDDVINTREDTSCQESSSGAALETVNATDTDQIIERPVFRVQAMSLKAPTVSGYKPPPPKRLVSSKNSGIKKKLKSS